MLQAFFKYMELGGYVMPPLVLLTLTLWYGLGYRISMLRGGRGLPARDLVARASKGELRRPRGPVERAAALGVALWRAGHKNLVSHLDDTLGREALRLRRFRVLTTTIVAVAPLLGLLGTVSGMIETFSSLGDMTLTAQSGGIAAGVSQALLTTQFGLAVAIPGLIINGLLMRKERVATIQMDEIKEILGTYPPPEATP